jgi:hypothetical protein
MLFYLVFAGAIFAEATLIIGLFAPVNCVGAGAGSKSGVNGFFVVYFTVGAFVGKHDKGKVYH